MYGLTLERSPVKARLRSERVGHVFYASEQPPFLVEMANRTDSAFEGKLAWRITDYYGKTTEGQRKVKLPGQQPHTERVDLRQSLFGWFKADLMLRDDDGRVIWEHPTSFAILPPDTRKAGPESPYGIWWFRRSHVGTDSIEEVGPLLQRLGLRHVCPSPSGPDGAELAKHGLSFSMYSDFVRRGDKGPKMLDDMAAKHPGVRRALIFHECGVGEKLVYPPEFLGQEPPKLTDEQEKNFKDWWDKAIAYSKYCREKHPNLKLIVGNSSLPFLVEFMRRGYPREYVDAFGDEDAGQSIMP